MEEKIITRNLDAYFGTNRAVKDVNIGIPANSVTAIIGPSGCGKSTFIRCLNRMHEFTAGTRIKGEVLLDGVDVYGRDIDPIDVRTRVGMVFQKPNPFPALSIYDNTVCGLKLKGIKNKKILAGCAEESLKAAGLWEEVKDKLNHSGVSLSGGQQQRLCIARTLAVKPEVVLFDEPTSALDPLATAKIEELIFLLKESYTIVIVTHNMQQASRVSDQTGFFLLGQLVEYGRTGDIFTNPQNKKTEDYITGRFG